MTMDGDTTGILLVSSYNSRASSVGMLYFLAMSEIRMESGESIKNGPTRIEPRNVFLLIRGNTI